MALPSTGEKIKYRPFTVKEEKILLVAQESKDAEQEILASKQVVNNCLIDKDVSELAMFDLEYVLILLKSKSVDNNIRFSIKDPDTDEIVQLELDTENIQLKTHENHTNKIKINEDYTMFLKYPTVDEYVKIVKMDPNDPLVNYFLMTSCLDKIASEDEVHDFKNYNNEEIDNFMEQLSSSVIKSIQQFFETMPKLRHEMKYKNKDGAEKTFVIEGLRSFFI
jgi:hypothetical protein